MKKVCTSNWSFKIICLFWIGHILVWFPRQFTVTIFESRTNQASLKATHTRTRTHTHTRTQKANTGMKYMTWGKKQIFHQNDNIYKEKVQCVSKPIEIRQNTDIRWHTSTQSSVKCHFKHMKIWWRNQVHHQHCLKLSTTWWSD